MAAGEAIGREDSAEQRLASDARFALALEAGSMGVWEWRVESGLVEWSETLERIHGLAPGSFGGQFADFERDIHPDDRALVLGAIERCLAAGGDYHVEYRILRPDGTLRWLEGRGRLLRRPDGGPERMVGLCMDVTDRKESERHQDLLLNELNHRVNNALAIVQGLACQTLREAGEPADLGERFLARLGALAAAHALLTDAGWRCVELDALVSRSLAPFETPNGGGLDGVPAGPSVRVAPDAAVTLSLVLHELAAEAARAGAFATAAGRPRVSWSCSEAGDAAEAPGGAAAASVELLWRLAGAPAVAIGEAGFARRLIAASAGRLGGEVALERKAGGLEVRLTFPLPRLPAAVS